MKPKILLVILLTAIVTGTGTWFVARQSPEQKSETSSGRKILYYQSPMHPWIKSDKPGKCTVCGMTLVPIYEGESGVENAKGIVTLSSNSVNVVNVQTAEVKRRPLVHTLRVAGTIEDDDTRHRILSAYVEGRVEKLFVNYVGAEVTKGQPLATFYSPMLVTAQREYLTLAKQHSESNNPATGREGLAAAAAQRLKLLGLSDEQIAALRESNASSDFRAEILAPMTGTVVAREVYEGQYVKEGDRLFEIGDFSTMWFEFDAYERDLAWLKVGQTVDVTTPSAPGKVFSARLTFIDPNLNDPTRTAKVRVEISNPLVTTNGIARRELLHRLYAEGIVRVDIPETLTVPRSAVLSPGQNSVVYIAKGGGAYEQRKVKLGRSGDESWEVLDGLREGEMVVTTGNLMIDAQAQLAESANGHGGTTEGMPTAALPALTEEQHKAANEIMAIAGALSAVLAADNVEDFNEQTTKLHTLASTLTKTFATAPGWLPFAERIESAAHIPAATDLVEARKLFLPFSMATVELARRLRAQETNAFKIYMCPMVNAAIPGAPKDGFWIQTEAPLRNPFYGSEMLDCGTEVK